MINRFKTIDGGWGFTGNSDEINKLREELRRLGIAVSIPEESVFSSSSQNINPSLSISAECSDNDAEDFARRFSN
jgi:hypothetical protein